MVEVKAVVNARWRMERQPGGKAGQEAREGQGVGKNMGERSRGWREWVGCAPPL